MDRVTLQPKRRPSNRVTDAQGRVWQLRFTQYQQGWTWSAEHHGHGRISTADETGPFFPTREAARADARRAIEQPDNDHIAMSNEFFARLHKRHGMVCQLTAEDHAAIERAGRVAGGRR